MEKLLSHISNKPNYFKVKLKNRVRALLRRAEKKKLAHTIKIYIFNSFSHIYSNIILKYLFSTPIKVYIHEIIYSYIF